MSHLRGPQGSIFVPGEKTLSLQRGLTIEPLVPVESSPSQKALQPEVILHLSSPSSLLTQEAGDSCFLQIWTPSSSRSGHFPQLSAQTS